MTQDDPFGPDDEMLPQTGSQSPLWANVASVILLGLLVANGLAAVLGFYPWW